MKYRGHNAKRDSAEPAIVKALAKAGWEVHRELPVDLLCLKRVSLEQLMRVVSFDEGFLLAVPMEAKTARGKRQPKAVIDKRQAKQNAFCDRWNIPKPTTPMEALLAVGERVEIT
jgi:hypothetical protein